MSFPSHRQEFDVNALVPNALEIAAWKYVKRLDRQWKSQRPLKEQPPSASDIFVKIFRTTLD